MNTHVSSDAQAAIARVRALRILTEKTGFQTTAEQSKVLLGLNNQDLLDVAEELRKTGSVNMTPHTAGGAR